MGELKNIFLHDLNESNANSILLILQYHRGLLGVFITKFSGENAAKPADQRL